MVSLHHLPLMPTGALTTCWSCGAVIKNPPTSPCSSFCLGSGHIVSCRHSIRVSNAKAVSVHDVITSSSDSRKFTFLPACIYQGALTVTTG